MKVSDLFVKCLESEIYGRLTGTPAVCLGTLGPGATHLITGVPTSMWTGLDAGVVPIDYSENMKLSQHLGELTCSI